jgi:hypothetical protein
MWRIQNRQRAGRLGLLLERRNPEVQEMWFIHRHLQQQKQRSEEPEVRVPLLVSYYFRELAEKRDWDRRRTEETRKEPPSIPNIAEALAPGNWIHSLETSVISENTTSGFW